MKILLALILIFTFTMPVSQASCISKYENRINEISENLYLLYGGYYVFYTPTYHRHHHHHGPIPRHHQRGTDHSTRSGEYHGGSSNGEAELVAAAILLTFVAATTTHVVERVNEMKKMDRLIDLIVESKKYLAGDNLAGEELIRMTKRVFGKKVYEIDTTEKLHQIASSVTDHDVNDDFCRVGAIAQNSDYRVKFLTSRHRTLAKYPEVKRALQAEFK